VRGKRTAATDSTLDFAFSMAFQPIVDMRDLSVFAYEALVRGPGDSPAADVLARVTSANRHAFDQQCRMRAIETASQLGITVRLSVNVMPAAAQDAGSALRATQAVALHAGITCDRIVFEASEVDRLTDPLGFRAVMGEYKRHGFETAIDDFGDGFASLSFLADFQPDYLKLDMNLIRGVDTDKPRQAIVAGITKVAELIGTTIIAEGVETAAEMRTLRDLGIPIMQGYLFAAPALEALPCVELCRHEGVRRGRRA